MRTRSIEELLDTSRLMVTGRTVADTTVLITSVSGGIGIIMAEAAVERGLKLARLSDAGKSRLRAMLPFMTPANPLEVTAQIVQDFGLLETALPLDPPWLATTACLAGEEGQAPRHPRSRPTGQVCSFLRRRRMARNGGGRGEKVRRPRRCRRD